MSELGEIHKEINIVSSKVDILIGKFDATIPHLATKQDLTEKMATHIEKYNHSIMPKSRSKAKLVGGLIGALTALSAAVYALASALAN